MDKQTDTIIELHGITKVFEDGFKAVDDFNLEVKRGEFVTFLGPSGCGKTTTLRMIAGFDNPTEGDILLNGSSIIHLPPYKRPINTVFQRYALFPHMNIYENIAFGLRQKKTPGDVIDRKVRRVLDLVDLEGFEKRKIQTLSGGQQQRIAIASWERSTSRCARRCSLSSRTCTAGSGSPLSMSPMTRRKL